MKIRGSEYSRGGTIADANEAVLTDREEEAAARLRMRRERQEKYRRLYGPLFWKWPHRLILWQAPYAPEIKGIDGVLKTPDVAAKRIRSDMGLPDACRNPDTWTKLAGGQMADEDLETRDLTRAWLKRLSGMRSLGDAIEKNAIGSPAPWADTLSNLERRKVDLDAVVDALGRAKSARIREQAKEQNERAFLETIETAFGVHQELANDLERFLRSPGSSHSEVREAVERIMVLLRRKLAYRGRRKKASGRPKKRTASEPYWRDIFAQDCKALNIGVPTQKQLLKMAGLETRLPKKGS